jgi:protein-S-isoprenylcysteine O-methyltransferase Ste14
MEVKTPKHAGSGEIFITITFICISIGLFWVLPSPSITAIKIYTIYFLFQFFSMAIVPGTWTQGLPLENGKKLWYNCNGIHIYIWTIILFFLGGYHGLWKLSIVHDHLLQLVTVTNYAAWLAWIVVFIKGRFSAERVPYDGIIKEIWLGAELNPRIFGVDLKVFYDGRPSLLTWVIVSLSMASVQYEKYGKLSTPMMMFVGFSLFYMFDFFFYEDRFLTGWEICQERLGFMLIWGNTIFMPFFCNLQSIHLIEWSELPIWAVIGITISFLAGFVISHLANGQKDLFKRDSEAPYYGIEPKYISTEHGRKILVSGFWGASRHPNYCGELLNSLSFCLMCGFKSIIPYGYAIFIWTLLFTRFERDDRKCQEKYGKDWKRYTEAVPYKIIPYVY